jgi:preprotein translocase subunit SecG
MSLLASVVLVIHLLIAMAICGFVLLQHGKGADMGAAFGSGSSGSVFGSAGSANFLSRTTGILAFLFFVSSVTLTVFGSMHTRSSGGGLMDRVGVPTAPAAPGSTLPGASTAPAKAGEGGPAGAGAGTSTAPADVPGNATNAPAGKATAGTAGNAAAGVANAPAAAGTPAKGDAGAPSKSSEVPK